MIDHRLSWLPSSIFLKDVSTLDEDTRDIADISVSKIGTTAAKRRIYFAECDSIRILRSIRRILVRFEYPPSPPNSRIVIGGVGFVSLASFAVWVCHVYYT